MGNNSLGSLKVCQNILDIFTTSFANLAWTNGRIILNPEQWQFALAPFFTFLQLDKG
jgi:hypothetical protein